MALSQLIDHPLLDLAEYRTKLYYGKYRYRARFMLAGLWMCHRVRWALLHDRYDDTGEVTIDVISNFTTALSKMSDHVRKEVIANRDRLNRYTSWLNTMDESLKKQLCVRSEWYSGSIFSNDLQQLTTIIGDLGFDDITTFTEARVHPDSENTIFFRKEPGHKFRVYFKNRDCDEAQKREMKKLLVRRDIKLSPVFSRWLEMTIIKPSWWATHTRDSFYIDYSDPSILTYLVLVYGDYLGKHYCLEKQPAIE